MTEESRKLPPTWMIAAAAIGGAYGLRRVLAAIGKQRVMKSVYNDLTPRELSKYLKDLRSTSSPWISRAFEKVHVRSR